VDYLFAQVSVTEAFVDTKPNCGNMLPAWSFRRSKAAWFARESHHEGAHLQRQYTDADRSGNPDAGGQVEYAGDTHIDGVTDPAAAIKLTFLDALGAVTGKLLPTGSPLDRIDGIEASCVDMAMPVMIMAAEAFGKTGRETPEELDADKAMLKKIEPSGWKREAHGDGTYRAWSCRNRAGVAAGAGREHRIALLHAARLPSLACRDRRASRRRRRGASRNRREPLTSSRRDFPAACSASSTLRVTSRWT